MASGKLEILWMYAEVGKVKWISNYSSIELVGFGKEKMDRNAFGLFWANGHETEIHLIGGCFWIRTSIVILTELINS